jgi:hypothetical protein
MDFPLPLHFVNLFIQEKHNTRIKEFLTCKEINIFLKLIFILKHNSKEEMILNLNIMKDYYRENALLEGLIITGKELDSAILLQNYLNKTDDLLVTNILVKFFVNPSENFYTKCENDLFEILNKMKMFNERIHFNQKLNEIYSHLEKGVKEGTGAVEKKSGNLSQWTEMILNCFYCNSKIHSDRADNFRNLFMNSKDKTQLVSIF